ncbi:MAG: MerR family transcriptional regulator [Bacteroidales bacterium]|nr:MerR family transcriptional regulator [Bacteroidales bacterium]
MLAQMEDHFQLDNNKPVYTLGIASRLSDIPAHSIRQYIDMGMIIPFKLESRRHLFSPNDIGRLRLIRKLIHEKGLNFAGVRTLMAAILCWAIRRCPENEKKSCGAYKEDFQPCWEASAKSGPCRNENCRDCEVYQSLHKHSGIKSVLEELI